MKTLKTIKYALILASIFTFSACELIEEPNFDTTECTSGCNSEKTDDIEE